MACNAPYPFNGYLSEQLAIMFRSHVSVNKLLIHNNNQHHTDGYNLGYIWLDIAFDAI